MSRALAIDPAALREILGLGLSDDTAHRALAELCDEVGGRLAGSEGHTRAEAWARRWMKSVGLSGVRVQRFRTPTWGRGSCTVEVEQPALGAIAALAHGFAPRKVDVRLPLVDAGHGLAEDFERLGRRIVGKLALVRHGQPAGRPGTHRSKKYANAVAAKAGGMLLLSGAAGRQPQTGMCARAEGPIPSVGITQEDGERLLRLLDRGRPVTVRVRMTNTVREESVGNVLGDLTGSKMPDEIVVAGGHLDAWDVATGALDNGAGCAVVLGAARILAGLKRRPKRTVRFAMWGAEEIGIVCSREYVRRNARQLDNHIAYLNYDMPGDPKKLGLVGRLDETEKLRELEAALEGLGISDAASDSLCLATDLRPFFLAGIPWLTHHGPHPGGGGGAYHTASDTFEKVDRGVLLRAATCCAVLAYALADAKERVFARHNAEQVKGALERAGEANEPVLEEMNLAPVAR